MLSQVFPDSRELKQWSGERKDGWIFARLQLKACGQQQTSVISGKCAPASMSINFKILSLP